MCLPRLHLQIPSAARYVHVLHDTYWPTTAHPLTSFLQHINWGDPGNSPSAHNNAPLMIHCALPVYQLFDYFAPCYRDLPEASYLVSVIKFPARTAPKLGDPSSPVPPLIHYPHLRTTGEEPLQSHLTTTSLSHGHPLTYPVIQQPWPRHHSMTPPHYSSNVPLLLQLQQTIDALTKGLVEIHNKMDKLTKKDCQTTLETDVANPVTYTPAIPPLPCHVPTPPTTSTLSTYQEIKCRVLRKHGAATTIFCWWCNIKITSWLTQQTTRHTAATTIFCCWHRFVLHRYFVQQSARKAHILQLCCGSSDHARQPTLTYSPPYM